MTTSALNLNEEEFLQLPWDDSIKKKLKEIIDCSDYKVLCAIHEENKLKAVGFEEKLEDYPENCVGLYFLPDLNLQGLSRTQKSSSFS